MCDSRRPEAGADSEPVDPRDTSCDYCGKTVWDGSLRPEPMAGSIAWKCGACRQRAEDRYAAMTGDAA